MTDPALPAGARIIKSALPGLSFVKIPVASVPKDGTMAVVTDNSGRQVGAIYRDGVWRASGKPINWEPSHWAVPVWEDRLV